MITTTTQCPSRTSAVAAAFLAAALLALSACGGTPEEPKPRSGAITEYAALGDSYTAVSGAGPFSDDACARSDDGYPGLLAAKLSITDLKNASCGGAKSENLTETQYPNGQGRNPPQLDSVSKSTQLVTLGMGLNDEDLSAILLYSCYTVGGKQAATCKPFLDAPESALNEIVAKVGADVTEDLAKIKSAAPSARVILVGYPRALPDDSTCTSQLPLPPKASARYRTAGVKVNDTLKSVAKKAGVDFIDMYAASKGHDLCSTDPWVNGQRAVTGEALAFHPYEAYHVAVADKIAALLAKK